MMPMNERASEVFDAPEKREIPGIKAHARTALATLKSALRVRDTPEQLPVRLQRDAGLDELDMECRRIARRPLIR
ncbi:hypothetical protein [Aestuariicoccus sp. MJ-SS9]|uniref:hypothetical protein n=1 Tax=Aestuariicoccus sp. MJ-SS9 TaxID=3079855 RepID=UPI002910D58C|nr:hypothetical protein [Aestuariicoccus sp. MJ-SS9]MDU8913430.1 hypothetical protein [Aestuariicoccus sp. MJ-SS9]